MGLGLDQLSSEHPKVDYENENRQSNRRARIGYILLALALLITGIEYILFSDSPQYNENALTTVGSFCGMAAITYFIWSLALRRKRGLGMLIFGLLCLLISLQEFVHTSGREYKQKKMMRQEQVNMFRQFRTGSLPEAEYSSSTYGRWVDYLKGQRDCYESLLSSYQDIIDNVKRCHEVTLTQYGQDPAKLQEHIALLQDAIQGFNEFPARVRRRSQLFTESMAQMPMSDRERKEMTASWNKQMEKPIDFQKPKAFLEAEYDLLVFLEKNHGKYVISGGKFLFQDDALLAEFSSKVLTVRNRAAQVR